MDFSRRVFVSLLLAGSVFAADPIISPPVPGNRVPPAIPVGKTLVLPITASDSDLDPLTFKVTSNNAKILARVKTGNPLLRLTVKIGNGAPADMTFQLFREWAPIATGFIGGFAQSGFFNNLTFHRVVKNFVIQGGDPLGNGQGGPGMTNNDPTTAFKFDNEFQPGLIFSGRGQLAMANSGYAGLFNGTNGSQFFVTLEQLHVPTAAHGLSLDFKHTIFGQMLTGWETLDAIANLPVDANGKPTSNVVITQAGVEPDDHDAVLMLSATALVPNATITVTASDGKGGVATSTFSVSSIVDGANSPPVVQNISPMTTPVATQLNFPLRVFDLESDFVQCNHGLLTGTTNARSTQSGSVAAVLGNPAFEGTVRMGFNTQQYSLALSDFESPLVQNYTDIAIGDRAVRADAVVVNGVPANSFTGTVARFQDLDPSATPANYSATTINWGDGSAEVAATVARDTEDAGASKFVVTGTHTFARKGTYTIVVTVKGDKGAIGIARSTAVITAAAISAVGRQIDVVGATVKSPIIATFTDSGSPGRPTDYTATVDWGDGSSSKGVISKAGDGSFIVRGSHVYRDAEPFSIAVLIRKGANTATDTTAWSTVNITGFSPAPHLPPFPVVHLLGQWLNSGTVTKSVTSKIVGSTFDPNALTENLTGSFVVENFGRKASSAAKIIYSLSRAPVRISSFAAGSPVVVTTATPHGLASFDNVFISGVTGGSFVSPTTSLNGYFSISVIDATHFSVPVQAQTGNASANGTVFSATDSLTGNTTLLTNGFPAITIGSLGYNQAGSATFTIALPKGNSGAGRYLLAQLAYTDPIMDASPRVEKVVIHGPIDPAVIAYNFQGPLARAKTGEYQTREDGTTVTFLVVLDTPPTANVTIPIESSLTTEGTVSPASITFTTAANDWSTGKLVTVTGVNDNVKDGNKAYKIRLKTPTSADPNYTGLGTVELPFLNLDND